VRCSLSVKACQTLRPLQLPRALSLRHRFPRIARRRILRDLITTQARRRGLRLRVRIQTTYSERHPSLTRNRTTLAEWISHVGWRFGTLATDALAVPKLRLALSGRQRVLAETEGGYSIEVVGAVDDGAVSAAGRLLDALQALDAAQLTHGRWLRLHSRSIVLLNSELPVAGFIEPLATIIASIPASLKYDTTTLAMLLSHEATHARVSAAGYRPLPHDSKRRAAVEQVCNREQLDVVRALDGQHPALKWAEDLFADPFKDWRYVAQRVRLLGPVWRRWRARGVPRVILRAIFSLMLR
jgi:hypothetical protein